MSFIPSTCNPAPSYGCGCSSPSPFRMPAKTSIEWALENPVLALGATAYESDTGKWKLGNGTDKYADLKYQSETGAPGKDGKDGANGKDGAVGPSGVNGQPGPPCSLTIGTVTTGPTASATITGTPPNQILNLVLPTASTGGGSGGSLRFVTQPESDSVVEGDAVVFTAEAAQSSSEVVTYKWQYLPANTSNQSLWTDVVAPPINTLRFNASSLDNGRSYRCIATSGSLSVTSASVMLSVAPQGVGAVYFAAQPFDTSVSSGGTAIFRTNGSIRTTTNSQRSRSVCKWQGSASVAGGGWSSTDWEDIPGSSETRSGFSFSVVLSFTARDEDKGRQFRCVVTSEQLPYGSSVYTPYGVENSNPATLTVT